MYDPDDDDDIFGTSEPKPDAKPQRLKKDGTPWTYPGRPRLDGSNYPDKVKEKKKAVELIKREADVLTGADLTATLTGVSIPFLCQVFRMGRQTLVERIRELNPVKHGKNMAPYYDLRQAAELLVTPKGTIESHINRMSPDDLPEKLRESYWNAKIKRQNFEARAGDLWPTAAIQEVLASTFHIIKTQIQLTAQTVDEKQPLTPEQRMIIKQVLDSMMNNIQQELVENARLNKTRSNLAEMDADDE